MEVCGGRHCRRDCIGTVLLCESRSNGRSQNGGTKEKEEQELDELLKELESVEAEDEWNE